MISSRKQQLFEFVVARGNQQSINKSISGLNYTQTDELIAVLLQSGAVVKIAL